MDPTAAELTELNEQLQREITERRRAEAALQDSQRSLSTLLSNLPGMAYRCVNDRNWTMDFVSEGCLALTGYTSYDLTGNQNVAFGQLIHPRDRAGVWEEVQAALAEARPFEVTYRLITASGQEKWVWEQGQGIFSAEQGRVSIEGFITDITQRTLAQRELEARVRARTRELTTLFEVQQAITRRLDPGAVMQLLADEARQLTASQRAIVFLLEGDELRIIRPKGKVASQYLAELLAACKQIVASGEPLYVPPDAAVGHLEPGTLLPLQAREQTLGVLGIIGPEGGGFSLCRGG